MAETGALSSWEPYGQLLTLPDRCRQEAQSWGSTCLRLPGSQSWNPQRWGLWNLAALGPSPAGWPGMTGMTAKLPQPLCRTQSTTLRRPPVRQSPSPTCGRDARHGDRRPSLSSLPPPCDGGDRLQEQGHTATQLPRGRPLKGPRYLPPSCLAPTGPPAPSTLPQPCSLSSPTSRPEHFPAAGSLAPPPGPARQPRPGKPPWPRNSCCPSCPTLPNPFPSWVTGVLQRTCTCPGSGQ